MCTALPLLEYWERQALLDPGLRCLSFTSLWLSDLATHSAVSYGNVCEGTVQPPVSVGKNSGLPKRVGGSACR